MKAREGYGIEEYALRFFFDCIGIFNHHAYFTQETWRRVPGFNTKDPAEVKCAFLSLWTKGTLGKITYPVGCSWSCWEGSEKCYDEYIREWQPVIDDYYKWCERQR